MVSTKQIIICAMVLAVGVPAIEFAKLGDFKPVKKPTTPQDVDVPEIKGRKSKLKREKLPRPEFGSHIPGIVLGVESKTHESMGEPVSGISANVIELQKSLNVQAADYSSLGEDWLLDLPDCDVIALQDISEDSYTTMAHSLPEYKHKFYWNRMAIYSKHSLGRKLVSLLRYGKTKYRDGLLGVEIQQPERTVIVYQLLIDRKGGLPTRAATRRIQQLSKNAEFLLAIPPAKREVWLTRMRLPGHQLVQYFASDPGEPGLDLYWGRPRLN